MDCSMPGFPVHHQLPEPAQTHVSCQWCHPTTAVIPISSCPQSFPASGSFPVSQFLASDGQSVGVSVSASVIQMNIQELISCGIDWFDHLSVQGTPKSLLQHQSSKVSILWCSAFFRVQLSHPSVTTGKTITLTRWTFAGRVMSLLFNMLSRLVKAFLPRSKCVLISCCTHYLQWFWSPRK